MSELASIILELQPERPEIIPDYLGRAVHGWFLQIVGDHDPDLALALHKSNVERPFTLSDLWGPGIRNMGNHRCLLPESSVFIRITSYHARLTALLQKIYANDALPAVSLGPTRLTCSHAFWQASATTPVIVKPWVGQTSFNELMDISLAQPQLRRRLSLTFASPTLFRSRGRYQLLPLPRLIFEGLVRRWNAYAPASLPNEVSAYADEFVVVSGYRLHTRTIQFGGGRGAAAGFVGRCTLAFLDKDPYWQSVVHLLANFALYAGVGKNTAMGLGQARLIEAK